MVLLYLNGGKHNEAQNKVYKNSSIYTYFCPCTFVVSNRQVLAENVSVISAEASDQTTNDGRLSNYNASEEGYGWKNEESKSSHHYRRAQKTYTTSTYKNRPWQQYAATAEKIVIDNPDAYIGNYAFYNFSSVINLEINNCGDIGKYAFQNCLKLGECYN